MQRLEHRHNQELAIVLRGVNQNTRLLEELNQRPPQHVIHSTGTDESWIPSTFHSVASNQHDQMAPGFSDIVWDGANQQHRDADQAEKNDASDEASPSHP